jgi:probable HAF family extracellular repeat protein
MNKSSCRSNFVGVMLASVRHSLIGVVATTVMLVISPAGAAQQHHHYKLIDMGTLGGPQSYFSPGSGNDIAQYSHVLNERGEVAGLANTPLPDPFPPFCFDLGGDCFVTHAFEAHGSATLTDLGALASGVSSAATWISANGLIAGLSQNGEIDPLVPQFQFAENHAVLWQRGEIIDLGTLEGGYESYAAAVNSRGQVVGAAINTVPDPNSMGSFWLGPPFPFETRAFLWEKDKGMQDLGTLPGGTDAQATLINEAGQVVGWSYTGSTPLDPSLCLPGGAVLSLETGSFIWEKGKGMRDLGSFGGNCTIADDLNDRGQIVGGSTLAGNQTIRAFLWDKGVMHDLGGSLGGAGANTGAFAINAAGQAAGFACLVGIICHATLWKHIGELTDLGVIGTDQCGSYATGINERLQIVGSSISSCTTFESRAFLWEDGTMFDLNALIPPDSALYLQFTETINSRGEIAGTGSDVHGNTHAFLLIPCDENHPNIEGCDYSPVEGSTLAANHPPAVAAEQNRLSAEDISRIRALLMKRHHGFVPRAMH